VTSSGARAGQQQQHKLEQGSSSSMACQQHRQACLARWPGHHSKHTETRRRRRNSQKCSQRSKAEGHGGDMTAQPRLWQQGHHPEATTERGRHRAHGRAAEHSMAATSGLQTAIQPTRRQGGHRKHRGARAEAPAWLAGVGQATRARSTGRSSAAMAAIGGKDDETPRSGGSAR
jgi:hypothetical protein